MPRYGKDNVQRIKSIQRIQATQDRNNSLHTATITAVDTSKTYVMDDGQGTSTYSVHAYSNGGNAYQNNYGQVSVGNTSVYAYLQDSTTVRYGQTTAGNRDNGQNQYHCIQVIEYE